MCFPKLVILDMMMTLNIALDSCNDDYTYGAANFSRTVSAISSPVISSITNLTEITFSAIDQF